MSSCTVSFSLQSLTCLAGYFKFQPHDEASAELRQQGASVNPQPVGTETLAAPDKQYMYGDANADPPASKSAEFFQHASMRGDTACAQGISERSHPQELTGVEASCVLQGLVYYKPQA